MLDIIYFVCPVFSYFFYLFLLAQHMHTNLIWTGGWFLSNIPNNQNNSVKVTNQK